MNTFQRSLFQFHLIWRSLGGRQCSERETRGIASEFSGPLRLKVLHDSTEHEDLRDSDLSLNLYYYWYSSDSCRYQYRWLTEECYPRYSGTTSEKKTSETTIFNGEFLKCIEETRVLSPSIVDPIIVLLFDGSTRWACRLIWLLVESLVELDVEWLWIIRWKIL